MRQLIQNLLSEFHKESELKEFARYDYTQTLDNNAVSRILFKIVEEYNNLTNPLYKRLLKEQAVDVLRKWTTKPPKFASQKVLERFLVNKSRVNPYVLRRGAKKQLRGKDKSIEISDLVWEHTVPVNITIDRVFKSKTVEEVIEALDKGSDTCWVTLDEDKCLNNKGFRKNRPENWREAYNQCNIVPLTKEEFELLWKKNFSESEIDSTEIKKQSPKNRLKPKKERIDIATKWVDFLNKNSIPAHQPNKNYPEYIKLGKNRENVIILFGSDPSKVSIVLENFLYKTPKYSWIVSNPEVILDYMNQKFPNLYFEVSRAEKLKTFKFNFDRFDFSKENLDLLLNVLSEFQTITEIPNLL